MELRNEFFIRLILFVFLYTSLSLVSGEKILFVHFISGRSISGCYEPLLQKLAEKGHSVTYVNPFPAKLKIPNAKFFIGPDVQGMHFDNKVNFFQKRVNKDIFRQLSASDIIADVCKEYYRIPEIQALYKEKFDLVIASAYLNECTLGLVHHLNTTFILTYPIAAPVYATNPFGNPVPPSFVPLYFLGYTHSMTFWQRLVNSWWHAYYSVYYEIVWVPAMESAYQTFFPNAPRVHEIAKNASILLMNSHFSVNSPRPLLPDIIEVAGLHVNPPKPLPSDLDEFISGAGDEGFIVFSMGTVVNAYMMPYEYFLLFAKAFSRLKQRVVWKWERANDTTYTNVLSPNVKMRDWLPQQDLLGHPAIRCFISHGGLFSTEETVYHGVPMIGLPVFGDQDSNMNKAVENGFAIKLELDELTEDVLYNAIHTILSDHKFRDNAKHYSSIFRDRQKDPLDTAVYWTEYVMRHKGATHMRSASRNLSWVQFHSLDVILTLCSVFVLVICVIITCCSQLCKVLFRKKSASNPRRKKSKTN